jgi:AcrR family transcriptional regulator
LSSPHRKTLAPQREIGRQRVADLMDAAAEVIQERGYEAATMAEIAARANARIGSLYRFFPNKEAIADALMDRYAGVLSEEYAALRKQASHATPEELADLLIDQLVRRYSQTRAMTALLDSRTKWTKIRLRVRAQALAGIGAALKACAPGLKDREVLDVAAVVLNNVKAMVDMVKKDALTTAGAPDELRLMNRLYLAARLGPGRGTTKRASQGHR